MRRLLWLAFDISHARAAIVRGASTLALASAMIVIDPGFQRFEKDNGEEDITFLWPGTPANAKKRRNRGGLNDSVGTLGRFSDGTTSNSISVPAPAASSSSAPPSALGTPSPSNSANNDSNSARPGDNGVRGPGGGRRDDDRGSGGGNSNGPANLVEGFKVWFGGAQAQPKPAPSKPPTAPSTVLLPAAKAPDKSSLGVPSPDAIAGKSGKPQTPQLKSPRGIGAMPTVPAWAGEIGGRAKSSSEILGVKLGSKTVEALQGLGYTIPPQSKNSFDVTRIYTPPGVDAAQAQDALRKALPKDKFEQNVYYRVYHARSATGTAHGVVDASPTLACSGSRCVPRDLIKWSPNQLDACSNGVAVGVLDTGIDVEHPALAHRSSGVFIPEGRAPAPTWHGTAVYALLAGNPKSGTPGLIPNARFFHGSVFFSDHTGEFATDTHVLLNALDWMDKADVKIVNMSFAGPRDPLIEEAIAKLSAKGMIFIAAAGNEGPTAEVVYPAGYRQVIAVTAIKSDRRIYPYANRGRHIDVAAPGVDIWTAVPGAREGYYTGTSFAAPFVTGLVATMYRSNPTSVKEKLLAQLEYDDLGIPGRDSTYGRGLALAPRSCGQAPLVAEKPAPAPAWGTTTVDKASTRGPTPSAPTISAGFR